MDLFETRLIHPQPYAHKTQIGAALAVLLYYVRMRQLLVFRRFLFLPEVVLLCIWMILIVLIPQVRAPCV